MSAPTSRALTVVVTTPAPGGGQASATLGVASQARTLSTDVQPILTLACSGCHTDFVSGSSAASLIGVPGCGAQARVVACGPLPTQSLIVDKLQAGLMGTQPACGGPMPASGAITQAEFETILDWVAQGAPQ
jgi:hypothetical protein